MKILFVGERGFDYNRVKILLNGLKEISEAKADIFVLNKKNFDKKKFKEIERNYDLIYVPPFRYKDNYFITKFAKIPVIFDPLVSMYMTRVNDYKEYWKAPVKYFRDRINMHRSDALLADTEEHKRYFVRKFGISPEKIYVLPIGVDFSSFRAVAANRKDDKFVIGFYGSFVPLQGVPLIIETANILKSDSSIIFEIIGDGYDMPKTKDLIKKYSLQNIVLHGNIPYEKLPEKIANFDVALGIFGTSIKTDVVVPNKIYHYSAVKKCTITKDTPAIREIFSDNENILLTKNEPEKIAEKILYCKQNQVITRQLGQKAFELIFEKFNEQKIAEKFINICKLVKNKIL